LEFDDELELPILELALPPAEEEVLLLLLFNAPSAVE
jgi:hypothetical protein